MFYTQVSYWFLVRSLLAAAIGLKDEAVRSNGKKPHTTFLFNSTAGLQSPYTRPFRAYVDWFQFVTRQIASYRDLTTRQKFGFTMSLILTKAWTSHSVLACWGVATNILFATYYYVAGAGSFRGLEDGTYLTALYFSFVTFTTVGYGDITPLSGISQAIVMLEILLGYLTLGCMVFLIGHKVSDRF